MMTYSDTFCGSYKLGIRISFQLCTSEDTHCFRFWVFLGESWILGTKFFESNINCAAFYKQNGRSLLPLVRRLARAPGQRAAYTTTLGEIASSVTCRQPAKGRHTGHGASRSRQSEAPSLLCPFVAGIMFAAAILYVSGWDFTGRALEPPSVVPKGRLDPWLPSSVVTTDKIEGTRATWSGDAPTDHGDVGGNTPVDTRKNEEISNAVFSLGDERHLFDAADAMVVDEALKRYRAFASSTLEADERSVRDGQPLQGKYIVLDSGNELVNRLRGVLSGIFLGILTGRVFVADITYQKDTDGGLLSALFEGPGYQWDLSQLSPALRRALTADKPQFRGARGGLAFDMSEEHFRRWVCEDVVGGGLSSTSVVTLSTVVYPFPLLARNPSYAAHPILSGGSSASGFAGGGQGRIEALETLLTRAVLRPTLELRERARGLVEEVRRAAKAWGTERGVESPVRVVGLHVRTYFVKAVAEGSLESNLKQFADCAAAGDVSAEDDKGDGRDNVFYFVATDEAATQALASKVWGKGCYFVPFTLPGSKLEGIKAAFVDLLVMGSLDDYVMTPHSSFSELGSTLSFTWLPDYEFSMRTRPNRPIVPFFPQMNDFERRKVMSLMDRRGGPLFKPGEGLVDGGQGACVRAHAAGMSLAIAIGKRLTSMFEAIEHASCLKGRPGIVDP